MLLKHFCKRFCYANSPKEILKLQKLSRTPFVNTLSLVRTTATISSPTVSSGELPAKSLEPRRLYFRSYLVNNSDKYGLDNPDNINLGSETNFKLLELLKSPLDDVKDTKIVDRFLNCLEKEFQNYGVEEMYKFITLISQHSCSQQLLNAANQLIYEMMVKNFSVDDSLKILFFIKDKETRFHKSTDFFHVKRLIYKMCHKILKLNSKQIVPLFFCLPPFSEDKLKKINFSVQLKLLELVPQLNAVELAIIASGYCRAGFHFAGSDLPGVFFKRTLDEIENINDESLGRIFLFFGQNLNKQYINDLQNFQKEIIPHMSKFSASCIVNLVLTGKEMNYVDASVWKIAADHFKENIEKYTIRDIQRFVNATILYNIQDEELLNLALKHFKEKLNVLEDFILLFKFLKDLIHHKLYPEDMLGLILSENFVSQFKPELLGSKVKHNYYFINYCVELEKPNHNFRSLSLKERKRSVTVTKILVSMHDKWNKCSNIRKTIMNELASLYGKDTVCEANCLPHYEHGLVMTFDKSLKAQTFESKFETHYYAKEAPKNDHMSLFLFVAPNVPSLPHDETPNLQLQTQIRQLETLGYKSVVIRTADWIYHSKNNTVQRFLEDLISKNLKEFNKDRMAVC